MPLKPKRGDPPVEVRQTLAPARKRSPAPKSNRYKIPLPVRKESSRSKPGKADRSTRVLLPSLSRFARRRTQPTRLRFPIGGENRPSPEPVDVRPSESETRDPTVVFRS